MWIRKKCNTSTTYHIDKYDSTYSSHCVNNIVYWWISGMKERAAMTTNTK